MMNDRIKIVRATINDAAVLFLLLLRLFMILMGFLISRKQYGEYGSVIQHFANAQGVIEKNML